MALEDKSGDFLIRIRACREAILNKPLCACDVYNYLQKKIPETKGKKLQISDVFSAGYIYKPIYYDVAELKDDDSFRLLKNIKKAKYIDKNIKAEAGTTQQLIKLFKSRIARIEGDYICSVLEDVKLAYEETFVMGKRNPISLKIKTGAEMEFYLSVSEKLAEKIKGAEVIELAGIPFKLSGICKINRKKTYGLPGVIEADAPVTPKYVPTGSTSLFRVLLNSEKNICFKAGSLFAGNDINEMLNMPMQWRPYVMYEDENAGCF